MMRATESLAQDIRIKKACEVLGIPRASYYYYQKHKESFFREITPSIRPLALSDQERQTVLDALHEERFLTKRRVRSMRLSLMREPICVLSELCTAFSKDTTK